MKIDQIEVSTPSKIQKLFSSFADSPTRMPSTNQSQNKKQINNFDVCFDSPMRRHSNKQLLHSYVSPFNPYLEARSSADQSLTDRYIPSRKLSKKQSLLDDQQIEENNQNSMKNCDNNTLTVADIYKKYIVSSYNRGGKNQQTMSIGGIQGIEVFQNSNIFRYANKNVLENIDISSLSKINNIQFADDLQLNSMKQRKIIKMPFKVLDAPALEDDYYLNLIDWSSQNLLAVGLASSVYLWNANNSKVTKLCDLGVSESVTSVAWSLNAPHFSLGTSKGQVHIWDVNKTKKLQVMEGHKNRIGALAWNSNLVTSGSRDKTILNRDIRSSRPFVSKLIGHKQQVCGLKWSFDEQQLCSGGNDNKLLIWSPHSTSPVMKFLDHVAAVKAMAWSPHQHGLLISGGGTADRTIRFRNTLSGVTTKKIDVGSQVCNLMFSKSLNQIVSTHGFSHNQINIWKYPKMQKITTLTGHTYRVLYLAMSPDGSTIVTGAGDQTLRFWNVFPNKNQPSKHFQSELNLQNALIR